MRQADLWHLALRGWRRIFFPGLFFLIAAVFFAGNAVREGWTVAQERQEPCRLTVVSESPIGDLEAAAELDGVRACSLVYEVDATVRIGTDTTNLTLTGVDGTMIEGTWKAGGIYPDASAMPYLVVNEAALRTLRDAAGKAVSHTSAVDWLQETVILSTGGGGKVTGKICGILADDRKDAPPLAYLSQGAAKSLLAQRGENVSPRQAWIVFRTSGAAAEAEQPLAALGLTPENSDTEREARWTLQQAEMNGFALAGGTALLAALALFVERLRLDGIAHREEYARLQSLGRENGTLRGRLNLVRFGVFLLAGLLGGLGLLLAAPVLEEAIGF